MTTDERVQPDAVDQITRLKDFARWLVAMDDPDDPVGLRNRQVVTLTQIIERAKAALTTDSEEDDERSLS